MPSRIRAHLRSNVVGYVALFLVVAGGTAYATHPGGTNTISSGDIINDAVGTNDIADGAVRSGDIGNNQVRGVDIRNDQVTGAEVVEASLDFDCPSGFSPAGDICFGPTNTGDHTAAESNCQAAGTRLPSVGEGRLIQVALGVPGINRLIWTGDHTAGNLAMNVFQLTDGSITVVEVAKSQTTAFICVRAPIAP